MSGASRYPPFDELRANVTGGGLVPPLRWPGGATLQYNGLIMEIGIIGLPKSGKTTLFNALTGARAQAHGYSAGGAPNVGMAKVEDPRLGRLTAMFNPRKVVPAEVRYVDVDMSRDLGKGGAASRQYIDHLIPTDALLHVVRAFPDPSVPHSDGSIDPARDIANVDLELVLSDLTIVDRRLKRIADSMRSAKPQEREARLKEQAVLTRIKEGLEKEKRIDEMGLTSEELAGLSSYQFLTAKPMLVAINIGEEQIDQAAALEQEMKGRYPGRGICAVCAKIEAELAQLGEAEARDFRCSWGVAEPAVHCIIRLSYGLLGLTSFFTVGADEVRAWTIHVDTPAPEAAGKVHSDIQRGFIRAEVVRYEDLIECGSLAEARKRGQLRVEGKTYIVKDGDIINFLFSV